MSAALAAALRDPAGRRRRAEAARMLAGWWSAQPALVGLGLALDALDPDDAGADREAVEAARSLIEEPGWLDDGFRALAKAAAADPLFEPPLRPVMHEAHLGLELYRHRMLALTAVTIPFARIAGRRRAGPPRVVAFSGRRSLVRFVRSGDATIASWRRDEAANRCRPAGRARMADGMVRSFDGVTSAWTLAAASGDVVLLQATARIGAPLLHSYDAANGMPIGTSGTEIAGARLQVMASLVGQLGRRDAVPALAAIARDGPPHQRWHVLRELVALDHRAARPLLETIAGSNGEAALADVARRTLALLPA